MIEVGRTAEIIIAYRKAIEILEELTNRDHYRAQVIPYHGFGTSVAYQTPYTNTPAAVQTYANIPHSTYSTPYSQRAPSHVVGSRAQMSNVSRPTQAHDTSNETLNLITQTIRAQDSISSRKSQQPERELEVISIHSEESDTNKETANPSDDGPLPLGQLDDFLTLANGGKLPGPPRRTNGSAGGGPDQYSSGSILSTPPSPVDTIDELHCRPDTDIRALVDQVANELAYSNEYWPLIRSEPSRAAQYASMDGPQLGTELGCLMSLAEPEINVIVPTAQAQAACQFYMHLLARAQYRTTRAVNANRANAYASQYPVDQWGRPISQAPNPAYGSQGHRYQNQPPQPLPAPSTILKSNADAIAPLPAQGFTHEHGSDVYEVPSTPAPRPKLRLRLSLNTGKQRDE